MMWLIYFQPLSPLVTVAFLVLFFSRQTLVKLIQRNISAGGLKTMAETPYVSHAPVFVTPAPPPHQQGWGGDSGANMQGNDLLRSPTVTGKCRACDITQIFPCAKSRAITLSRSLQCRAFSKALMDEKSLSPLFPIGGGAVVINDWCIIALCWA